jgi:hypothetical protein
MYPIAFPPIIGQVYWTNELSGHRGQIPGGSWAGFSGEVGRDLPHSIENAMQR